LLSCAKNVLIVLSTAREGNVKKLLTAPADSKANFEFPKVQCYSCQARAWHEVCLLGRKTEQKIMF